MIPAGKRNLLAVGPEENAGGIVRVLLLQGTTPIQLFEGLIFPEYPNASVRVALGDVNGDGVMDIISATGPGVPATVRVYDGKTGKQMETGGFASFQPFEQNFTGGLYVSAGDVNKDGKADIIVGAGTGRPSTVKVFSGANGSLIHQFEAYEGAYQGGVRVAAGDFNGDGFADIATGTPPGGGPRVKVLDGRNLAVIADDFVYESTFRGGVWIAAADVDGDGKAELIVGADVGGGPRLRVLKVPGYVAIMDTFVYESNFRGGVRVATTDFDNDGVFEIAVSPGVGGGPRLRVLKLNGNAVADFFYTDPNDRSGSYLSGPGN